MPSVAFHNIRLLTWFNFFTDFRPYAAIAILYFAQVTGSFALGLSIFALKSIFASVFEVPTGILSDRLGRKKTLIAGSLSGFLAILAYAMGEFYLILAIGALLEGVAISFFSGNNEALLYDSLKSEGKSDQYADFLGKTSAMFQAALGISALLGGFIADVSFRWVFAVSVLPQFICLMLSLFFIEPPKHYEKIDTNIFSHLKEALKGFMASAKLRDLSLSSIISYGIGETMHQFVPAFFALLWPTWALGIPRMFSHLFGALSFHFAGGVIRRFKATRVLLTCSFMNRVVNGLAYGLPTIFSPLLVASTSLTFGLFKVGENSLMQKEFTDHQRATMGSLNSLFGNLFFAVFAFLFGMVADQLGPARSLFIGEMLLISVLPIYWKLFRAK